MYGLGILSQKQEPHREPGDPFNAILRGRIGLQEAYRVIRLNFSASPYRIRDGSPLSEHSSRGKEMKAEDPEFDFEDYMKRCRDSFKLFTYFGNLGFDYIWGREKFIRRKAPGPDPAPRIPLEGRLANPEPSRPTPLEITENLAECPGSTCAYVAEKIGDVYVSEPRIVAVNLPENPDFLFVQNGTEVYEHRSLFLGHVYICGDVHDQHAAIEEAGIFVGAAVKLMANKSLQKAFRLNHPGSPAS